MPTKSLRVRSGMTLLEVVLVLCVLGITTITTIRFLSFHLDRIATRNAVRDAGGLVSRARDDAVALGARVSVVIDTIAASLTLRAQTGLITRIALRESHGVGISTTRDSVMFDAHGLGYGAANFTLIARRGASADTLVVSRLGRVRY